MANCKHGFSKHPTGAYRSWIAMRSRCNSKTHTAYARYGGRGITVCERWDDFKAFLEDMGERPTGMTIDRINNDGNYEPKNCRWASMDQQNENRHKTDCIKLGAKIITCGNNSMSITAWAERLGMDRTTISWRLRKGWPVEKALTKIGVSNVTQE